MNVLFFFHVDKHYTETKVLAYLSELSESCNDPFVQNICRLVLQHNRMGSIVFITPEIGRFSTVGGVGVVVNELTLALAALGCDIHVISPYYNFNRQVRSIFCEFSRNFISLFLAL